MNEFTPIRNNREAAKLLEEGWVIVRKSDLPRPVSNYEGVTGDVWTRIDDLTFSGHRDWLPGGGGPPPTPLTFDIGLIQIGMVVNLEPATQTIIGGLLEVPIDGNSYVRQDAAWVQTTSGGYTFGIGLDEVPAGSGNIDLLPATDTVIGGVAVPARSDVQGLLLDPTGILTAPLATDLLSGSIVEPPPDDLLYVRTRSVAGISAWVPNAAGADFGIGLSLDTTSTPPIVNLQPAGDSPATLGGVYVIDRVRNVTEGLELGIDGRLRAPLATDSLAGTLLEPPPDDRGYVRRRDLNGVSAWVPPATSQTDYGIGLSLDETTTPPIVNLQPAGYTEPGDPAKFLGGVFVTPATGLGLISSTGELSGMRATPQTIGMLFDAPFDDKSYARYRGSWIETTRPDVATIPIAGYTQPEIGAVYIVPDRALRVEADGALDVLPASPNQLGVIFDPPFDSGNPDVTYVRKWGSWVENIVTQSNVAVVGRSPLNGLESFYDTNNNNAFTIYNPLATDVLAGSIVEPPADNQVYVRSYDGTKGTWVSSSASAIIIQDDPPDPVTTSPNSLWWDSNAGDLFVLYQDVDSTQWVQINTAVPGNVLTDAPTDGNQYTRGSSAWNMLTAAVNVAGDIKTSMIAIDHNGWIKLDGRAISTLTASQQAEAIALGFATNLPDATNAVMLQNGAALGTISGSWNITLANLPDIDLTAASAGNHQHKVNVYDGAIDKNMYSLVDNLQPANHWASTLMCATSGGGDVSLNEYGNFMEDAGDHSHAVPLGGSGTPINPLHMSVNHFVFLGV